MTRLRIWGLSAALAAGGGAGSAAAQPPGPRQQTTLVNKLFGPKPPKPVGPTVPGATADRPPTITAPLAPEVVKDALRAEQDAYLRRVSVCTELRRVAAEKGDDALLRQADELERQAAALYNTRVAGLGVSRVRAPLPEGGAAFAAFDPPASPADKARKLEAPNSPAPGSTAGVIREVPQ